MAPERRSRCDRPSLARRLVAPHASYRALQPPRLESPGAAAVLDDRDDICSLRSCAVGGAGAGPVVQAGVLGWLAIVTSRRGIRTLLAAGAVASMTYLGVTADVFRQPWNPDVALVFFLLFVFLVCVVATGGFRQLIGMSIAGSIIVQTHVGFLPLVVAGFVWALGWAVRDWRREDVVPERWRSTVLIASVFTVLVWIPPVVGVVVHTPGNLGSLVDYFTSGSHPSVGVRQGLGIMAAEFRFVPPWLGGAVRVRFSSADAVPSSPWLLLGPFALLALGGLAAYRTQSRDDRRMVGFAAVLLIVGIFTLCASTSPFRTRFNGVWSSLHSSSSRASGPLRPRSSPPSRTGCTSA